MAEIDQAGAAEGTAEKRVFIRTFGCQMNEYDTGKMRAKLAKDGFVSTEQPENADLILLNTCSVRDKAVVKMHSALGEYRKLKKDGRKVKIGVTGCVAQMEGEALTQIAHTDAAASGMRAGWGVGIPANMQRGEGRGERALPNMQRG